MRNKALLNIIASTSCQIVTIVAGLIVNRIFLATFGSEANGLVATITQYLNYISLVEGGLGGVVLSALYGPLAKKNNDDISSVLAAANKFFRQISYIFVAYVIVLFFVFPLINKSSYDWFFVSSLTVILAISLFIQYFFSISYKLLLQADQRMYVVQITQIIITILNLIVFYLVIVFVPNVHIVKLLSALVFAIQPIVFSIYVKKHYKIKTGLVGDPQKLPQRWSCFGLNLAYFIHENTDIVVLSLFTDMFVVSVYYVYAIVVNHLKGFFNSFSHAYAPLIGKAIAVGDNDKAVHHLDVYEFVVTSVSTIVFGVSIYLLPSFVLIYTKGVNDAEYYQPVFSTIILLAEMVYCIRDPYVSVVYAAGKFKETTPIAYCEAGINITISLFLVNKFGLVGIAIGTFIAMTFRMIYLIYYISRYLIKRPVIKSIKRFIISAFTIILSIVILHCIDNTGSHTILLWIKNGFLSTFVFVLILMLFNLLFDRKNTINSFKGLMHRKKSSDV